MVIIFCFFQGCCLSQIYIRLFKTSCSLTTNAENDQGYQACRCLSELASGVQESQGAEVGLCRKSQKALKYQWSGFHFVLFSTLPTCTYSSVHLFFHCHYPSLFPSCGLTSLKLLCQLLPQKVQMSVESLQK